MIPKKKPNQLIYESSPYLLQHAYNPVNWLPWNDETLKKAAVEQKPLIVSIGYSACHWCHVMEGESFEDEEVADLMNRFFICIKIDREERPDIDAFFMDALHLMQGNGGWPLNMFALPDGRPFWGGTYFRKNQWLGLLKSVASLYQNKAYELIAQAEQLEKGLHQQFLIKVVHSEISFDGIDVVVEQWKQQFDYQNGGFVGAPKFPMPPSLSFLMHYAYKRHHQDIADFVLLSLQKMAQGGIYDQIGGGFARYSVDNQWKVPHFEKMLYDNAQLISVYAKAFVFFDKPILLEIAENSFRFAVEELQSPEGLFYAALDADSEGEEGSFYVWTEKEFRNLAGKHAELMQEYFGVGKEAFWEQDKNILLAVDLPADFAKAHQISEEEFCNIRAEVSAKLLEERKKRPAPALDNKLICSWNALMIEGISELFVATGKTNFLEKVITLSHASISEFSAPDKGLKRIAHKEVADGCSAFFDDYAFTIRALLKIYRYSFQEIFFERAMELIDYVIRHFLDASNGMFFYTHQDLKQIDYRKHEIHDMVIPSSSAVFAHALYDAFLISGNPLFDQMLLQMLKNIYPRLKQHIPAFSEWASLIDRRESRNYILRMGTYSPEQIVAAQRKNPYVLTVPGNAIAKGQEDHFSLCDQNSCFLNTSDFKEVLAQITSYEGCYSKGF